MQSRGYEGKLLRICSSITALKCASPQTVQKGEDTSAKLKPLVVAFLTTQVSCFLAYVVSMTAEKQLSR